MAEFKQGVITNKGLDLLARAQAGTCKITFTRFQLGDGTWDNASMEAQMASIALKKPRAEFPVAKAEFVNNATSKITLVASNANNKDTGYFVREIGVWATDGKNEVLYVIFIATTADWFAAMNSLTPSSLTYPCYVTVGNASTVTVSNPNAALVNQGTLDDTVDALRTDYSTTSALLMNAIRQEKWTREASDATFTKDIAGLKLMEKGTVTLTNSDFNPFNNSLKSVSLKTARASKDYVVTILSAKSTTGNIGEVVVSDRLVNGFKLAFTGSAASVTVEYMVTGGYWS